MSSRSASQWRAYLTEYSADVLRVSDRPYTDEQRASGWLGFGGASEEQLAGLEQRLGVALPPSLRSFLEVSDGWINLSPFLSTLRTSESIGWFREAKPEIWEILLRHDPMVERALLISGVSDAQEWLLDPDDVSADGEWAAYIWASWYPGAGPRHDSFADLVDAERAKFEEFSGRDGRPVDPSGAEELVESGRASALRGDVAAAAAAFDAAAVKGSGAGAYLAVILKCFRQTGHMADWIRNGVLPHPHVIAAIDREQLRAEIVPLFGSRLRIPAFAEHFSPILSPQEMEGFEPPVLSEPPAFAAALSQARELVRDGSPDEAWEVIRAALPGWHSDSPNRIAPVILLTDPLLATLITPTRAGEVIRTPRGTPIV